MSRVTTHVLDTSRGRPAAEIPVVLQLHDDAGRWLEIGRGVTDADGRISDLMIEQFELENGTYRLQFEVADYLQRDGGSGFFPRVTLEFEITDASEHYHVPLLLSPFGYSTYRGS